MKDFTNKLRAKLIAICDLVPMQDLDTAMEANQRLRVRADNAELYMRAFQEELSIATSLRDTNTSLQTVCYVQFVINLALIGVLVYERLY
jgi:hypothetical protein